MALSPHRDGFSQRHQDLEGTAEKTWRERGPQGQGRRKTVLNLHLCCKPCLVYNRYGNPCYLGDGGRRIEFKADLGKRVNSCPKHKANRLGVQLSGRALA
jgi:hypothetical protein